jgi:hypothetical protein
MRLQFGISSTIFRASLCAAIFFVSCQPTLAQNFVYIEQNNALCPAFKSSAGALPKVVKNNAVTTGDIRVSCGFTEGSYTVTLSATDPNATFTPKTFLVNFGALAGNGKFSVKFSTLGEQTVFATITSNMGSPLLMGEFKSVNNAVNVIAP